MAELVPEFISTLRDIRDVKYPTIVANTATVVEKEALMNPHYDNIDALGLVASSISTVASNIANVNINATNIVAIQNASANATTASDAVIATNADVESTHSDVVKTNADVVTTTAKAVIAQKVLDMTTSTATLVAGSNATSSYNPTTGIMAFGIPQGTKGEKGDSFSVNAVGLTVDRSLYDEQVKGFSFLAIDTALMYFKLSNTSADWSDGASFGVGPEGPIGVSISTIVLTSTLDSVDTYTITFTDATTTTFNVTNGTDGLEEAPTDGFTYARKNGSWVYTQEVFETTQPIISIATPVNERSNTVGTITNYDADATYYISAINGTISYTTGSTFIFTAVDITNGVNTSDTISVYATKAGELQSLTTEQVMTIVYVPIEEDTAYQVVDFTDEAQYNDGFEEIA